MLLLAATLAPSFAIIFYIIIKDKHDKEPFKEIIICFLLGALGIIPAVFIEQYLENKFYVSEHIGLTALSAFFGVALPEEMIKFLILRYYIFKKDVFNEPFDGIVYAVIISMGFATIENVFYVMDSGGGLSTAIVRMFSAVPAHAIFGITMGFYIGKAKFETLDRNKLLIKGLVFATILHGLYDFFLFQQSLEFLGLLSFIGVIVAIKYARKAIQIQSENSPFNNKLNVEKEGTIEEQIINPYQKIIEEANNKEPEA